MLDDCVYEASNFRFASFLQNLKIIQGRTTEHEQMSTRAYTNSRNNARELSDKAIKYFLKKGAQQYEFYDSDNILSDSMDIQLSHLAKLEELESSYPS